ncbi:glycosyltransferase family 4 protein [Roseobacter litoralis]|uniref:glycosyltransferase family 4 protein n=1 Tax=Roseobacter litoralis TaxID=42443 RepID=UPI00248F858F|nr:glycosyltransferase family 4 protein [Roseobacter litoralis]
MSLPSVILISERFGHIGGGEAIKAQQYADFLLSKGYPLKVITAERSKTELGADIPAENLILIPDTAFQKFLWRVRLLRNLLGLYFQIRARQMVIKHATPGTETILHYISPVSPVELRFPPTGYHTVFGPLTGNIYYPPGFRYRMTFKNKLRERLHGLAQRFFGRVMGNKRNVDVFLVSGYERTRASLRMAGCRDDQMIDVVDSGVSDKLASLPRVTHAGENTKFLCAARFVDYKGVDLAIQAVAAADPRVTLSIYGDGELKASLQALVTDLDLKDRVTFHGWIHNDDLIARFSKYRGYIMPSLAEANGIIMQETMMAGLPVVTFRWGGPGMLADDDAALYIAPHDAPRAVQDIAAAMTRLAHDGAYAEALSQKARKIAESRFTWQAAATSWLKAYERH